MWEAAGKSVSMADLMRHTTELLEGAYEKLQALGQLVYGAEAAEQAGGEACCMVETAEINHELAALIAGAVDRMAAEMGRE